MKNKKIFLILIVVLVVLFIIFLIWNNSMDRASSSITDNIDMSIDTDNGDEKIDWTLYEEGTYELSQSIEITKGGVYNLSGTIKDGIIKIDTTDSVKLVLNNVSVTNFSGPSIYVAEATDVVIELQTGSSNYLEDGASYSGYDEDEVGTIFSHDDITFLGDGFLEIKANSEDGIVSKDDLKIVSGNYKISSVDDGIRGKDSVYIKDGTFEIVSGGDGIKTTNDTDVNKGYILIEKGNFNIDSELDGIQAETKLLIQDGEFNIVAGGGSVNTSISSDWGNWGRGYTTSSNSESAKGLKSGNNLLIENGTFTFDTADDSIHCNNYLGIKNGTIKIKSGDDGIHADTEVIIDGGSINIDKSYEGLEGAKITINGGNIELVTSDDGINVAGGNDGSATNRPGENNYSSNTNNILTINGGNIYVNATGDGIDVNGYAYINGGYVLVDGPTNSGNGSLDYDRAFEVNGGTLIAGGSRGMLQGCSSSSKLYNVTIVFGSTYGSGDVITIVDGNDKEIVSYQSNKNYSSLLVATSEFKKETSYTIRVNGNNYESFTISSITTTIGNSMMIDPGESNPGNRGNRR